MTSPAPQSPVAAMFTSRVWRRFYVVLAGLFVSLVAANAAPMQLSVDLDKPGKPISPDLFGIFFEDISYSADGGLYAELIQNRSFEYQITEQKEWNPLSFWELVQTGNGKGRLMVDAGIPVNPNNPHYLVLDVSEPGDGVGVSNPGFDGIPIKQGETYDVAFFARQLFAEKRWGGTKDIESYPMPLLVRLESKDGQNLGQATFQVRGVEWSRIAGSITATSSDDAARFVLLARGRGGIALDEVSLFPRKTFRDRTNGMRADLAQAIADLHPRFVRFPGGCVAHGNGLGNLYRWKDTVGPLEGRKQLSNLWGYHQSLGIGFYEYFQFCEDIGARPLPVMAAGVCCQNAGMTDGRGQRGIPMADMPAYVQDVLDLIEWANGPTTSRWGALRTAAGHPAPFGLKYLGVGNEDQITPAFRERFQMIYEAVKNAHPEITIVGTVGPGPDGEDYDNGWKLANELRLAVVDEHFYKPPAWFWRNLHRYDSYHRDGTKVYVGEYAAHDVRRRSTLRAALAEAAGMTSFERNGDAVALVSYAPLLAKRGYTRWSPDLIYFTNTQIELSTSYWVQRLFASNSGDTYLETVPTEAGEPTDFAASCVQDSKTGDLILKLVNGSETEKPLDICLQGKQSLNPEAELTVLAGPDPLAVNDGRDAKPVLSVTAKLAVASTFVYTAPANSLSVIRVHVR